MSAAFVAMALLAVVNPFRVRLAVPEDGGGRARMAELAGGALLLLGVAAVVVAASVPLLDWLDISPETWRIAAGLVVVLAGAWVIVFPQRTAEPELPGRWAALVPVLFPYLLTPEVLVAVWSLGADEPAALVLSGLAASLGVAVVLGLTPKEGAPAAMLRGAARLLAALAVVVGIALIISGIREV